MAYRFPELDHAFGVTDDVGRTISDGELEDLRDAYVDAASLAFEAGFDAVDVKSCHGYLLSDLLSSFKRGGEYGGESFEKRCRFLLETVTTIKKETGGHVTTRLNAYDGFPPPYGFGAEGSYPDHSPYVRLPGFDPAEPMNLLHRMRALGVDFVNITIGNPYYSQFLTRPFEVKMRGQRDSPEHPLRSVGRHFSVVEALKRGVPDMVYVGSGYSWLRQYGVNAAAHNIENSRTDIAGWGRLSIAFPEFPKVAFSTGSLPKSKVCVTCSRCSRLLRAGFRTGCATRNLDAYKESMKMVEEMSM